MNQLVKTLPEDTAIPTGTLGQSNTIVLAGMPRGQHKAVRRVLLPKQDR